MDNLFDIEKVLEVCLHSAPLLGLLALLLFYFFRRFERRFEGLEETLRRMEIATARYDPQELKADFKEIEKTQKAQAVDIAGLWEAVKTFRLTSDRSKTYDSLK